MTRTEAREEMMKIIFQMGAMDDYDKDSEDVYFEDLAAGKHDDYCHRVFEFFCDNHEKIDEMIAKNAPKWELKRMPKTDTAILRLACTEIMYMDDVPSSVAINEAVELAKRYSDDSSPAYINGILGTVARS